MILPNHAQLPVAAIHFTSDSHTYVHLAHHWEFYMELAQVEETYQALGGRRNRQPFSDRQVCEPLGASSRRCRGGDDGRRKFSKPMGRC